MCTGESFRGICQQGATELGDGKNLCWRETFRGSKGVYSEEGLEEWEGSAGERDGVGLSLEISQSHSDDVGDDYKR